MGASNINANSDYDSNRNAKCTSVPFQEVDKSSYWAVSGIRSLHRCDLLTAFSAHPLLPGPADKAVYPDA